MKKTKNEKKKRNSRDRQPHITGTKKHLNMKNIKKEKISEVRIREIIHTVREKFDELLKQGIDIENISVTINGIEIVTVREYTYTNNLKKQII